MKMDQLQNTLVYAKIYLSKSYITVKEDHDAFSKILNQERANSYKCMMYQTVN